jgi:predicted small lipoprotein YifL
MKYAVKPWCRSTPLLLLMAALAACGQRGPLYLPEAHSEAPPETPADSRGNPAESDEDDDKPPRA